MTNKVYMERRLSYRLEEDGHDCCLVPDKFMSMSET